MSVMLAKCESLLGEIKDHLKIGARPPLPDDRTPERLRFTQLESVVGPEQENKRLFKQVLHVGKHTSYPRWNLNVQVSEFQSGTVVIQRRFDKLSSQ